jgi:hypothetical protein
MDTEPKIQVCVDCGSSNVVRDAEAAWCEEKQEWELSAVLDQSYCRRCGEVSTVSLPISIFNGENFNDLLAYIRGSHPECASAALLHYGWLMSPTNE